MRKVQWRENNSVREIYYFLSFDYRGKTAKKNKSWVALNRVCNSYQKKFFSSEKTYISKKTFFIFFSKILPFYLSFKNEKDKNFTYSFFAYSSSYTFISLHSHDKKHC